MKRWAMSEAMVGPVPRTSLAHPRAGALGSAKREVAMRQSGRWLIASIAVGAALSAAPSGAGAYDGLHPGGRSGLPENVTVNVVFVGFKPAEVPWSRVRAELPDSGDPLVRSPEFYGRHEPLGLHFGYDYQPFSTDAAWEDDFFGYL